ncbi:MAG: four helix bundle protein [Prevotellaceae bacterium]|nr:four helix bundle protein [Prevotellaceae bacterium]
MIQKFEDIIAWQKAQDLAVKVYQTFNLTKDYGFKDQICRAAVSVSNNIAEGFERNSDADFVRFLNYSLGSNSEVKSMLFLANRLNYISNDQKVEFVNQTEEIAKIIKGLKKSLKKLFPYSPRLLKPQY